MQVTYASRPLRLSLALLLLSMAAPVRGDEPRFTRHVVPLLSKLGCNSGSCHGMVQGKGGFRLSLFGAQPMLDYERLAREFAGRRVNQVRPETSLLLLKATAQTPHGGGQRLVPESDDYALLSRWITAGVQLDKVADSIVVRLDVSPAEQACAVGDELSLVVRAEFADGAQEDVTALCAFEVLRPNVATVDRQGRVQVLEIGDTTVVVRYPGQVAWCTLIVAPRQSAAPPSDAVAHNFVDQHVLDRLRLLNLAPAPLSDDSAFLRRVTLDVTGALPSTEEVRAFLADTSPTKRAAKIDELLQRSRHAALWATKFMDYLRVTGFSPASFPPVVQDEFRAQHWLRMRLEENLPYDELVERILTATSREGRPYQAWAAEVVATMQEESDKELPAAYAARRTLDLFWQRRMETDVDHAIRIGHSFLGLRLECAQCHRHPHDVWTQEDLLDFANFFMRTPHFSSLGKPRAKASDELLAFRKSSKAAAELPKKSQDLFAKTFGEREVYLLTAEHVAGDGMKGGRSYFNTSKTGHATVSSPLGTQSSEILRLLSAKHATAESNHADRRQLVMDWLRRPDNPYFAKAIVNRVWAHYFDRGIVDPPDDLSPLNPPSHPELLRELSAGFIRNNYDLRWLHRTILNSRTYQQSGHAQDNDEDRRSFASYYLRRLPAEVLLDIVDQATGVPTDYSKYREARGGMPAGLTLLEGAAIFLRGDGEGAFALTTFGRPERDVEVVCDCERDNQATMLQALFLANHPHIREQIAGDDGRVATILKQFKSPERQIEELFLATYSRLPTEAEMELCQAYVGQAASPRQGLEELLWGLLNSNEFMFNQ